MVNMHNAQVAGLARPDRPTNETAHVASAGRIEEQENKHADFHGTGAAAQVAPTIEGEDYASAWLGRLHAPSLRCVGALLRRIGGRA